MRAAVLFFVLFAAIAGADEPADPQTARAADLYRSATTHYSLREFEAALKDFQEGYRLHTDPAFLFNIGQCQRQLGDLEGAVHSYGSYLRDVPEAPNRVEVRHLIATLQARIQARPPKPEPTEARRATPESPAPVVVVPMPSPTTPTPPPAVRKPRAWAWAILAVGSVAVAGLAVGLGVGLSQNHPPDTTLGTSTISFK